MGSKFKNKLIILVILVIIATAFIMGIVLNKKGISVNKLSDSVSNTSLEKAKSYRMDLRIYGIYNNKGINKIIMVNNYKNTDKEITVTVDGKEEKYLIKDNKNYKIVDDKLSNIDKVPYENTEVYLNGVNKLKNLKQEESQSIGKDKYNVYKGEISAKDIEDILKESDLDIKTNKDIETEVWLTSDNYVYKVYYKLDNLTIYASYFGYGSMNKVNLDMYK